MAVGHGRTAQPTDDAPRMSDLAILLKENAYDDHHLLYNMTRAIYCGVRDASSWVECQYAQSYALSTILLVRLRVNLAYCLLAVFKLHPCLWSCLVPPCAFYFSTMTLSDTQNSGDVCQHASNVLCAVSTGVEREAIWGGDGALVS